MTSRSVAARPTPGFQQRRVQCRHISDVDDQPRRAAPGNDMHPQCGPDTLPGFTELIAHRRAEDHARISDVHRCAGVLKTARIDFDLRFGLSVSIRPTGNRQISAQRRQVGTKQRREARHMHDRTHSELDGLTENILGARHVRTQHPRSLTRVGCHQRGAVHDGVASVQRLPYRIAVGYVCNRKVRHVDAQFRDRRLQPCGISHQEPDGVARVSDGFGSPPAHKSRTAGDQNAHGGILHWITAQLSLGWQRSSGYRRLAAKFAPWPTMPFTAYRPCATGLLPSPQIESPSAHN